MICEAQDVVEGVGARFLHLEGKGPNFRCGEYRPVQGCVEQKASAKDNICYNKRIKCICKHGVTPMLGSSKACPMENCTGVKNSVQQFMNIVLGKLSSVVDPVAESR